jgi:hypothetical protein
MKYMSNISDNPTKKQQPAVKKMDMSLKMSAMAWRDIVTPFMLVLPKPYPLKPIRWVYRVFGIVFTATSGLEYT